MPEPSDRLADAVSLTAAVARADPEAFGLFYEMWFDRAYALARSITRKDEAFCLDVVQDTMLRVVRSMRPLRTEAAVAAWMAKAVHATAIDRLRSEAGRARRERAAAVGRPEATERGDEERIEWLRERLSEMSAEDRMLLAERFDRAKTLQAVGASLGVTGDAAHGRIRRILERLRVAAREFFHD